MNVPKLCCLALLFNTAAFSQTPAGWKIIHDKSGACQAAVPADWNVPKDTTWIGQAPADQGDVQIVSQPGRAGVSPDMVKKIVATLSAAH